ncbi:MAG: MotA/TolQ/ExbB proton channel family protein [Proteobacteria bacterium]|nr:MAG: MotA/TolQ/ExbB proton channel family protein [Pseudomonadota bacterium]
MYVIAAIGILTVILIVERFVTLRALTVNKADFNEHLFGMILRGDVRQAITYCDSKPTPLTTTLKAGLVQVMNHRPDEEVQVAMDASVLRESPRVEGWSSFLAVFGNVATLIGLVGTISGMIKSFQGVAQAGAAEKAALLSEGISEALHCTAFGLIVAILAITMYGYFQLRISRILNDVVESSMSMMNLVVANRDKVKE